MGVNHQKSADRLAHKASENAREEFDGQHSNNYGLH